MKLYFKVVALLVTLGVEFGLILPYLISSGSNELAALGGLLVILTIPAVAYYATKHIFKTSK